MVRPPVQPIGGKNCGADYPLTDRYCDDIRHMLLFDSGPLQGGVTNILRILQLQHRKVPPYEISGTSPPITTSFRGNRAAFGRRQGF